MDIFLDVNITKYEVMQFNRHEDENFCSPFVRFCRLLGLINRSNQYAVQKSYLFRVG